MKIAITGHSKGIGAEFKSYYESQGHTILGFSRSNGYDLRNWDLMHKMLAEISDCDMLISCAKPDFVQTTLLYEVWKKWQGQPKTIINISSMLVVTPCTPASMNHDPMLDLYRTSKVSLEEATRQLSFKSELPYITTIRPGHLYSSTISITEQQRLSSWVKFIASMLDQAKSNSFFLKEITLA